MLALLEAAALSEPPVPPAIEYAIGDAYGFGHNRVRGIQVGAFAIRASLDQVGVGPSGVARDLRAFSVDHWPSRWAIGDFQSFESALLAADELSRCAPEEHALAADDDALGRILTGHLLAWLEYAMAIEQPISYRQWLQVPVVGAQPTQAEV
jgi:hypothetical protein